ncbi:2-succinyl-6-hydroxy-2,4-cyclohexadiene-1-carboxylate synthase [Photobacterium nomapromontoriensis]|uniref:2-succinyl-6-hydroxy-2, 4-cyclohexadiene-1-carboxylate synthase n=1 Tax=Photobacterium nomapromontoriensis TaxID=2910237 RepID=UPI003D110B7C
MLLYSETFGHRRQGDSSPTLVFLHGLLGSGRDWRDVVNQLDHDYFCMTIDLPGHGQSRSLLPEGFAEVSQWLRDTLSSRGVRDYVLIGYSLGARLAMYHACQPVLASVAEKQEGESVQPHLVGLVLEGGNFGLPLTDRAARWRNDQHWAQRFADEPISQVLADWYQQSVFSSLDHDQRQGLQAKRSDNLGRAVAHMLMVTSLAKQPELLPDVTCLPLPVQYLCGEDDSKFKSLAADSGLSLSVIPDAGHNVHVEQPYLFAMALQQYLFRNNLSAGCF